MENKLDAIKRQKSFYLNNYYNSCRLLLINLIIITLLTVTLIYFYLERPEAQCYANDREGKLSLLFALTTPNYSNESLLN